MKRRYHIRHRTTYCYAELVDLSYNQVRLTPRSHPGQTVISTRVAIEPKPVSLGTHRDAFGNEVSYFEVAQPHRKMSILAESIVETESEKLNPQRFGERPWEAIRDRVREGHGGVEDVFFSMPTPTVPCSEPLLQYARPSFPAGRSLRDAAMDLMQRIFREFAFDNTATTVSTPLHEEGGPIVVRVYEPWVYKNKVYPRYSSALPLSNQGRQCPDQTACKRLMPMAMTARTIVANAVVPRVHSVPSNPTETGIEP